MLRCTRESARAGELIDKDPIDEIVAELAMHFEQGQDRPRALRYLLRAADNALQRSAHHEAAALAQRALRALKGLPATPDRDQQELRLRMILGVSLVATKGFAAADVEAVYRRAWELCSGGRCAVPDAFRVLRLMGLWPCSAQSWRRRMALPSGWPRWPPDPAMPR